MKNLFVIIFIVSSINCSFLRKLTDTEFNVSQVALSECINLGSNVEATLTFTVANVGEVEELIATFTLEGSDSPTLNATCTKSDDNNNFGCQLSAGDFKSLGSYKLTSISGGANTFNFGEQTPSLKVAQTYELGTQTASQTINEEKKSFEIVFKGELKDKSVPQIFATANSESSIQGCSVDENTVVCTPTTSEMPVGTYEIHYLNGCDKELTSTGVTVEVSSSGTGSGTGSGSGSGTGSGSGSGSGTGAGSGSGTDTGNQTETNSESKSAFITLSTLTLFVFGILF